MLIMKNRTHYKKLNFITRQTILLFLLIKLRPWMKCWLILLGAMISDAADIHSLNMPLCLCANIEINIKYKNVLYLYIRNLSDLCPHRSMRCGRMEDVSESCNTEWWLFITCMKRIIKGEHKEEKKIEKTR